MSHVVARLRSTGATPPLLHMTEESNNDNDDKNNLLLLCINYLCRLFTLICLKQTVFGYTVLQILFSYHSWCT